MVKKYKMSIETREKIRLSRLGKKWSEENKNKMRESALRQIENGTRKGIFTKGHILGMKGKHHTDKTKNKISESNIGKKHSGESYWKGKINPLTVKRNLENNPMKNKEISKKVSEKSKGKHYSIKSEYKKGDPSLSKRIKELRIEGKLIIPKKDTSIEIKIQNFLKQLNIEFFTHQYIKEIEHGYQCDILIPSMNLVIECDGDYWHKYPIGNDIDHIRTKELLEKGFKVLRLWEHEIRPMQLNEFKDMLI